MPLHELPTGRIALAGAGIAATVVAAVLAVLGGLRAAGVPPGGERLQRSYDLVIPAAGLDTAPQPALQAYRARKAAALQSIGWVDAPAGIAHIPIDDAMALLAQRAARASEAAR